MKLDVKKIKRNLQKLTGGSAKAVITPVQLDVRSGFCTPAAPAVLKYRVDRYAAEQLVITPTPSMSILSLEVRDDQEEENNFIARRKKDVLHTIKTTTKMKRSQASTHINIINLDSIKNLATAAGQSGAGGKKLTSLKTFGVSLSSLFKPSVMIAQVLLLFLAFLVPRGTLGQLVKELL